jgi:hypothetical protein
VSEIEAAREAAELPPNRRRWLAVMVGIAAILAAVFTWVESDAGRQEEKALQDGTRGALGIFVDIAGSGPRSQFQADATRRALIVGSEGLARVIKAKGDAFKLAVARQPADSKAQRELAQVAQAMGALPSTGSKLDPVATDVLKSDAPRLKEQLKAQNHAIDRANELSTRGSRATFALGLTAIGAALLALAGIMGTARSGRYSLIAAGAVLILATLWGASGFL